MTDRIYSAPSPARPVMRHALAFGAILVATLAAIFAGNMISAGGRGDWHTPAFAVPLHIATSLPAIPLGLYVLMRQKGDATHRLLGRVWAALMMVTALDAFLIRELTGGLGPIHIFSVVTLVSIPHAIIQARRGNIVAHRRAMTGPYIGLIVAGLVALVPGRLLGTLVFG